MDYIPNIDYMHVQLCTDYTSIHACMHDSFICSHACANDDVNIVHKIFTEICIQTH